MKLGIERQIYEAVDFSGSSEEDNSNRNIYTPPRGAWLSSALKPFVEPTFVPRFHVEELDRNGLRCNL